MFCGADFAVYLLLWFVVYYLLVGCIVWVCECWHGVGGWIGFGA